MINLLAIEITVQDLIEFIESVKELYSSLGIIAAIGLPYVETIVPIAPLFLMLSFNILSYGIIFGILFTYIGTTAATITIFLFLRYFSSKDKINPKKYKKVMRYLDWIENTHPILHILSMMIPLSPAYLINYSMGLSNVSFGRYLYVTLISRLLMLIFCLPFGMTLITLYESGELGGVQVLWLLIFGTIVIAGIVVGQKINKKIA
ncbi:SNARE associated Golgi protein [Candidatus Izimaplasma bacterium HR1]|jgi:uncharacterized membrane protein YdjX (TVP38/TMEM64 family)|uniref:TVP38/TMEM64 family protein n=1 Tax=Candidatus Izimoplasma sp. HR1 TaxID=1541959 RepID=UPI0004F5F78A|nr:SNARE associated Golgi protein [Candidatus Izimaplasma bacterium HR1]